jgi:hypothetical protein
MSWLAEADASIDTTDEAAAWAASGALALTGAAGSAPVPVPGGTASLVRAALDRVREAAVGRAVPGVEVPGVEVLGERAALAGFGRNAPWSAGGAFRAWPTRDGWVGLSLARTSDVDLVPALVEGSVDGRGDGPWPVVRAWLERVTSAEAEARIGLLGLAGAAIPPTPPGPRRPPVLERTGGRRRRGDRPLVVDLTSLWAGPLCARLLGATGARVVKVEHAGRLDGARRGEPRFYDLLHAGHESVVVDFRSPAGRAALHVLLDAADVVLEASRPRALRQLGVDADAHVARGAVWLSITAYGRVGEDAHRIGFGDDVAAGAGLVGRVDGVPAPAADAVADPLTGTVAAACVVEALTRDRGCLLDVSMHDVAAFAAALDRPEQDPAGPTASPPYVGSAAATPAAAAGADTARVLAELGVATE